jgi:hypothetical protein
VSRNTKYIFKKPDGKGGWKYYYKNDIGLKSSSNKDEKFNPEQVFNVFNKAIFEERVGDFKEKSEKLIRITEIVEKNINHRKDAEYCGVLSENGDLIFTKKGISEKVEFEDDEIKKIKKQKIMTHNHIKDRGLSPEDIFLAIFLGIEEVRAVFENKTFSFKVSYKEKSKSYQELQVKNLIIISLIDKEVKKIKKFLKDKVNSEEKTGEQANREEQRKMCEEIIKNDDLNSFLNMEYEEYEK